MSNNQSKVRSYKASYFQEVYAGNDMQRILFWLEAVLMLLTAVCFSLMLIKFFASAAYMISVLWLPREHVIVPDYDWLTMPMALLIALGLASMAALSRRHKLHLAALLWLVPVILHLLHR